SARSSGPREVHGGRVAGRGPRRRHDAEELRQTWRRRSPDGGVAVMSKPTRGKFEIYRAPEIKPTPSPDQVADLDLSSAAEGMDCSALFAQHDEAEVRHDVAEMTRAILPGARTTTLFEQQGPEGMSLEHVWFGPNFPLF